MAGLPDLRRSLDAARAAGRVVDLWWRDDDLQRPGPELDAMLATLDRFGIVPALAVIPSGLDPAVAGRLAGTGATVFLHGWAHANHALPPAKKSEFGPERPVAARLEEVRTGWQRLSGLFGARAAACFTPPWNRIGDDLAMRLGEAGMAALSGFARPGRPPAPAGVPRLDTHVDLIDWRGDRRPLPAATAAAALAGLLESSRRHESPVDAPVGLLSHHRVTDPASWTALEPMLGLLAEHPAAHWLTPRDALTKVGVDSVDGRVA